MPNAVPRPGPVTEGDLEALLAAAGKSAGTGRDGSFVHLSSKVRDSVIAQAKIPASNGSTPASATTVMAAVAVMERLSSQSAMATDAQGVRIPERLVFWWRWPRRRAWRPQMLEE